MKPTIYQSREIQDVKFDEFKNWSAWDHLKLSLKKLKIGDILAVLFTFWWIYWIGLCWIDPPKDKWGFESMPATFTKIVTGFVFTLVSLYWIVYSFNKRFNFIK